MMRARGIRRGERGSTMVVVMMILLALLAAGAGVIYLQVSSTRATGLIRQSRDALFCAEAGLARTRNKIGASYALWDDMLDTDPSNDPGGYPYTGDIDGDDEDDWEVTIKDNDDENPATLPNDLTKNNDLKIFVVSKCIKYPDTPREIMELVTYTGAGNVYRDQNRQGSGGTDNANTDPP
jgi:hypothetical protein